jgi:integrase
MSIVFFTTERAVSCHICATRNTCARTLYIHFFAESMPYQYIHEPLTTDEANRLASACETHPERLIVWTLLDTGLRVAQLAAVQSGGCPG